MTGKGDIGFKDSKGKRKDWFGYGDSRANRGLGKTFDPDNSSTQMTAAHPGQCKHHVTNDSEG
jgi:hypothetical protein